MNNDLKDPFDLVSCVNQIAARFYATPQSNTFTELTSFQHQLEECIKIVEKDGQHKEARDYIAGMQMMLDDINKMLYRIQ